MDSTQFVNFFCEHVLPHWDEITNSGPDNTADPKLELLKVFAEISEYCGELDKPQEKVDTAYNLLMVCLLLSYYL